MGGINSGCYQRTNSKRLTTDMLDIDLRRFKQRGWLKFNSIGTLSWTRAGYKIGEVEYVMTENAFHISYYSSQINQSITQSIHIKKTACNFGGSRLWFECPSCRKNVLLLYGGEQFHCRKCHELVHPSVNESKIYRALRAVEKYQNKLSQGSNLCALDGIDWIEKPKWMRWHTYEKIQQKAAGKQSDLEQKMTEFFGCSML
ncbi:hypothetical protein DRW07_17725 [Alteromonas sediminis]|uniref:Uncharacterized protein n=1 Tax=Alteromonas sediminis TaxID=2259342 RepID=A0A3N5XYS7_9ALTE|nr:hypothetical protein [Alteromonas sediminis]RPJ65146.1 hypothetical protein DRW07_17725 [Alteromonas sediminis]